MKVKIAVYGNKHGCPDVFLGYKRNSDWRATKCASSDNDKKYIEFEANEDGSLPEKWINEYIDSINKSGTICNPMQFITESLDSNERYFGYCISSPTGTKFEMGRFEPEKEE